MTVIFLLLFALAGCTAVDGETAVAPPTVPPAATNSRLDDPVSHDFRQWARFDAIRPIYDPVFGHAGDVTLQDEELIMGVTLGGQAKAYPVTVMQFREMVNDELAGIPILITW